MKLFGNTKVVNNEIYFNGISVTELSKRFGTPLYIFDEKSFIEKINLFKENFASDIVDAKIIYASKSLLNLYIAKIIYNENLYIDAVSVGEVFTILKSGFDPSRIYFHGNNKLKEELEFAIKEKVGTIVIDNKSEAYLLDKLLSDDYIQDVMIRLNPGIEAHTHEFITTAKSDSKFGMSIYEKETLNLIKYLSENKKFNFKGIHSHIGSQIFEKSSFFKGIEALCDYALNLKNLGIRVREINLGGGFGVYYTQNDRPLDLKVFLKEYIKYFEEYILKIGLDVESVAIEPGRALINQSVYALYKACLEKKCGERNYLFIDGSMCDNIRPALYGAKYEACVANRFNDSKEELYTIAGKCCESGDVLIKDIELPKHQEGDLVLVPSVGAYTYSMSSNYNKNLRPEMISVNEDAKVIVNRETLEDLIKNDLF